MKRLLLALLAVVCLAGCATAPRSVNGVYRPGTFAGLGYSYVAEFPVKQATKQEVLDFVGPPDKSYISDGVEYLYYTISADSFGSREYIYYIKDNVVFDVKFINKNPYATTIYQSTQVQKATSHKPE